MGNQRRQLLLLSMWVALLLLSAASDIHRTLAQEPSAATSDEKAVVDELALNQGILLFKAGRFSAAQTTLAELPGTAAAQYRALCGLRLGRYEAAAAELRLAWSDPTSRLSAALDAVAAGEFETAQRELASGLAQDPADERVHWLKEALEPKVATEPSSETTNTDPFSPPSQTQASTAYSTDEPAMRRWNYTVLGGYQYDSNVAISPAFVGLGAPTNRADASWFIASFGEYRVVQEADQTLGLLFSSYDNFYRQQTRFDFQDYMGGAYINRVFSERWLGGLRFESHESLLDYHHFASDYRLVPNLTLLEEDFGHLTSYYEFDSTFYNITPLIPEQDRDSRTNAFGLTQAIYRQQGKGRIFLGYRYEDVDARGSDWSRRTHMATARIERPLGERWVVDAEVRQFWDGYLNPNSLDFQGRPRRDERTEVRLGLQCYLTSHASLRLDYTYIQSNSNVANLFDVHFYEYQRHLLYPQFIYDF